MSNVNNARLKDKLNSDPDFRARFITNTINFLRSEGYELEEKSLEDIKSMSDKAMSDKEGFALIEEIMIAYGRKFVIPI